jgi:hypothetical protein
VPLGPCNSHEVTTTPFTSTVASVGPLGHSRRRPDRMVRQRGRALSRPRRTLRRTRQTRRRSRPWARSPGSSPPMAAGTSSASSSPMPSPPDHPLRALTSPGIGTSHRFHRHLPRPSSSAMAEPPLVDRIGSVCRREPRGCTSASRMLGLSRVRRASTRITAGRSRWPSGSTSARLLTPSFRQATTSRPHV